MKLGAQETNIRECLKIPDKKKNKDMIMTSHMNRNEKLSINLNLLEAAERKSKRN